MNVEIMIVSYLKDIEWLRHCLNSIAKFCTGFSGVTLVVPDQEYNHFTQFKDVKIKAYRRIGNPKLWHLHHQVQKCEADEFCDGADLIAHVDSDCIFIDKTTPDDYLIDGKPVLLIQSYATLKEQVPWKRVVDYCMGGDNKYETMRRHPALHYPGVYLDVRDHITKLHKMDFQRFVLSQKSEFPWGFTEFNCLGIIAISDKWKSKYSILDVDRTETPKEKLFQMWSLGKINQEQSAPHGEKMTPTAIFKKYGV